MSDNSPTRTTPTNQTGASSAATSCYGVGSISIYQGRCETVLPTLPDASFDSVVTDPPYPEIDRDYGRMTEGEWHEMMHLVVRECRRVLRPKGSAVFILQANSEKVGRMRPWLWEFQAWAAREWGIVQDAYWWNHATPPTVHCHEKHGLMRPSMKACVWLGEPDCYRDQGAALLPIAESTETDQRIDRHDLEYSTNKMSVRRGRCLQRCKDRGGVTPFNVLVAANSDAHASSGANGHGAGSPYAVADWWIRYLTPDKGVTLDPFAGAGTMLMAAKAQGLEAVGIEKEETYIEAAKKRLGGVRGVPLFAP